MNITVAFTHNAQRLDERIIMNHTKADETYAAKGVDLSGRNFLKLLDYTRTRSSTSSTSRPSSRP